MELQPWRTSCSTCLLCPLLAVAAAGEGWARCGQCRRWLAACASSLLEVDVNLPVIMQRQFLSVLYRITVVVPQIQFFDVGVVPQIQFTAQGEFQFLDKVFAGPVL